MMKMSKKEVMAMVVTNVVLAAVVIGLRAIFLNHINPEGITYHGIGGFYELANAISFYNAVSFITLVGVIAMVAFMIIYDVASIADRYYAEKESR